MADADRKRWGAVRPGLPAFAPAKRRELILSALELFHSGSVTVGGLGRQNADDFRVSLWETAGLPAPLVDRWSTTLRASLIQREIPVSDEALALVSLPGNTFTCLDSVLDQAERSAGVWVRPSRREPLSAARLVAALLAVGWPPDRLGFYPAGHRTLHGLVRRTDRQIVYGGAGLAASVRDSASLTLHGPGRGCALVPPGMAVGEAVDWLLPLIAADSGRFCSNVRTVVCADEPEPLASALAAALDAIHPDPGNRDWPLTVFREPDSAQQAAGSVSGRMRAGDRLLTRRPPIVREAGGGTYALPQLVLLGSDAIRSGLHPLIGHEVPFPFSTVLRARGEVAAAIADESLFVYRGAPHRTGIEDSHDG
ncbi:hypothetical protein ACFYWY_03115 [Streptomyces sp. NPDC002870]|uniref:hypothetical protein n=1 Tax=Streptomyces sp. NPDC002870 TaxID=3364666 RepID=UPI00367368A9